MVVKAQGSARADRYQLGVSSVQLSSPYGPTKIAASDAFLVSPPGPGTSVHLRAYGSHLHPRFHSGTTPIGLRVIQVAYVHTEGSC